MDAHGWQELRDAIRRRDGECVARYVNNPYWADRYPMLQGLPDPGPCDGPSQLDHVKYERAMGIKAPDDTDHLWMIHRSHHTDGDQWATKHVVREAAREYIRLVNGRTPRSEEPAS